MIQNKSASNFRLTMLLALLPLLILTTCSTSLTSANAAASRASGDNTLNTWSVSQNGNLLQIGYGSGTSFPQYAALDLSSSYFRMVYSMASQWGTSIVLL